MARYRGSTYGSDVRVQRITDAFGGGRTGAAVGPAGRAAGGAVSRRTPGTSGRP